MRPSVNLIRNALIADAVFSLATSLLLAIAPSAVGGWLGVPIDGWLRLLGLALGGHFAIVMWVVSKGEIRRWAQLNLMMVAPYPLMMIVATGLVGRSLGQVLVLVDGAIVGSFAVALWVGLRKGSPVSQAEVA